MKIFILLGTGALHISFHTLFFLAFEGSGSGLSFSSQITWYDDRTESVSSFSQFQTKVSAGRRRERGMLIISFATQESKQE
jgi:hypothetical protein